jgi:predicted transcriptional regulator
MSVARIEIIAELLAFCKQPKRKEWIEARLNLNEVFSQSYLTICLSHKLLDFKQDESYVTTEK